MTLPRRKPSKRVYGSRPASGPLRCPAHLKWVRGHQCCIAGQRVHVCSQKMEAAHVRRGSGAGLGEKPGDDRTISLCQKAHTNQHRIGEVMFEIEYDIDMRKLAAEFANKSPHLRRLRAKRKERE